MSNSVFDEIKKLLVCPLHQVSLSYEENLLGIDGAPWPDGEISCPQGCRWPILGGIPRFVHGDGYASSFGVQWKRYRRTELDSYTGLTYSRQRLERCLGAPLESLRGKVVLECGSGAGRFTELLAPNCENLVSIDRSAAVEANLSNCRHSSPYLLFQADINASPLPAHYFDVVICLGVIQHTASPEATIRDLAKRVKPGGSLVIDHYTRVRSSKLAEILSYIDSAHPFRAVLRHLRPEVALRVTTFLTKTCDPIHRRTSKIQVLDRIATRLLPTVSYYNRFAGLDPRKLYEWHELDTFDNLTDFYKHLRTPDQIRACLESLGLHVVSCGLGGNGVEARALAPSSSNYPVDRTASTRAYGVSPHPSVRGG
jgi:2-polyprenyl-3-methyl-5-hydroxy-6-metoxy-1,4-benzoquinol methylase